MHGGGGGGVWASVVLAREQHRIGGGTKILLNEETLRDPTNSQLFELPGTQFEILSFFSNVYSTCSETNGTFSAGTTAVRQNYLVIYLSVCYTLHDSL